MPVTSVMRQNSPSSKERTSRVIGKHQMYAQVLGFFKVGLCILLPLPSSQVLPLRKECTYQFQRESFYSCQHVVLKEIFHKSYYMDVFLVV